MPYIPWPIGGLDPSNDHRRSAIFSMVGSSERCPKSSMVGHFNYLTDMNCGDIPGLRLMAVGVAYDASRFTWRGNLWPTYTLRLHGCLFYHVHHTMIQQEHARTWKLDTHEKFPLYGINNTLNFVCMTHYLLYWSSYLLLHLSHFQWTGIFLIQTYAGHMVPWLASCALYHFCGQILRAIGDGSIHGNLTASP